MRRKLFRYIRFLALRSGVIIDRAVSANDLLGLIRKLRPSAIHGTELVRVGSPHDGGYLIPNDLAEITGVFSPGVATVSDFELFFAKLGLPVYMIDPNVDGPPIKHENFYFEKKSLSIKDSDYSISLESWVKEKVGNQKGLVLQMDIEGAEYAVLASTKNEVLKQFKVLIIEFHGLESLATLGRFELFESILNRLLQSFQIVHLHPNNADKVFNVNGLMIPSVVEITFLQRDDDKSFSNVSVTLPHPLDRPNKPTLRDIKLADYWLS